MGDMTENISRSELACSCGCGFDSMDVETIDAWQLACDHFADRYGVDKVVLRIHSAARCLEWNRVPVRLGGPGSTDGSQHPKARAIDGSIDGIPPRELYDYFDREYPDRYGIGLYSWGVHLDTRTGVPARW